MKPIGELLMEDQEQPRRLSPEWVAARLNSIEAKLDQILGILVPKKAVVPKSVKVPDVKPSPGKVVYDHVTERCYVVPPEEGDVNGKP